MTRYTVVWHHVAQDELTRLWMDAEKRGAITIAANAIDRHLGTDANEKGTPAPDNLRQLIVAPLRVLFAASEPDRMVRILAVTRW